MKTSHETIPTASEKLPSPSNQAAWLAWSHEMKGLFTMVGYFHNMKPAFAQGSSDPVERTSYRQYDINWNCPAYSYELVVNQNMIVASIAPEWKLHDSWREWNLYSNPLRLWKYLEKMSGEGESTEDKGWHGPLVRGW
jgi:hypothetical protein